VPTFLLLTYTLGKGGSFFELVVSKSKALQTKKEGEGKEGEDQVRRWEAGAHKRRLGGIP
jgi:hypothetical protein